MNSIKKAYYARWIIVTPYKTVKNSYLICKDNKILDITSKKPPDAEIIDLGDKTLMPGLINAHTHTELSAIAPYINYNKDFIRWIEDIKRIKDSLTAEQIKQSAVKSYQDLYNYGCIAIGDVSTSGLTKEVFIYSQLYGTWFKEYLGNDINDDQEIKIIKQGKSISLAIHALYSTSSVLIKNIKQTTANNLCSVHLAEHILEQEFITSKNGKWKEFLDSRGISYNKWQLPDISPVSYAKNLSILDDNLLAVHLLYGNEDDFKVLKNFNVKTCVCPRSNRNLHNKLPDLNKILEYNLSPALGTDSLASTDSLNIFDEMKFIADNYKNIPEHKIFEMATISGAKNLKIQNLFGSLEQGKIAKLLCIDICPTSPDNIIKQIIMEGGYNIEWIE